MRYGADGTAASGGRDEAPARSESRGALWLLADMALVTTMSALVKAGGAAYPAVQIVFFRCLVGFLAIAPLIWRERAAFADIERPLVHLARILSSAVALTANFTALVLLPLAFVTSIQFTRPLVLLGLAALLLKERVGRWAWLAGWLGLAGVAIAVLPKLTGADASWLGVIAAATSVLFGTLAVIATRRLRDSAPIVLMAGYTLGLALVTGVPAWLLWQPVAPGDMLLFIAIGLLAQAGQYCFLRAHKAASAATLAPLGYLHIALAALTGFLVFSEVPTAYTIAGGAVIVFAAMLSRR